MELKLPRVHPRTVFENPKGPWKVVILLPSHTFAKNGAPSGCFSKLEKTSQATRSGEAVSYPTLLVKRCKSNQCLPLQSCPLASSTVQRDGMPDSPDAAAV